MVATAGFNRQGSSGAIDYLIEKDHQSIDANLTAMKDFYGAAKISEMSPGEFYQEYKKFATGTVF